MKVAFLSLNGISDPKGASGTPYFLAIALQRTFGEVVDISPKIREDDNKKAWLRYDPSYFFMRLWSKLTGKNITSLSYRKPMQKRWAKKMRTLIDTHKPDLIFADKSSLLIPLIETEIPIFYRSDATSKLIIGYYSDFDNINETDRLGRLRSEEVSLNKSTYFLPLSDWAAQSAIHDYGLDPTKVKVMRSHSSLAREHVGEPKTLNPETLKFLFVGGDWERKGGELAIEVVQSLIAKGYNAEITVLCKTLPSKIAALEFVRTIAFVDRSNDEGEAEYQSYFRDASFFILPTSAEAMGQVFIDALMNGTPSISLNTGGVPEVVRNDETGLLFPIGVKAPEITERIIDTLDNPQKYELLSKNAINLYQTEFSFNCWSNDLHALYSSVSKTE